MKRRNFFASLAAGLGSLPFLGFLKPKVVGSATRVVYLRRSSISEKFWNEEIYPGITRSDIFYGDNLDTISKTAYEFGQSNVQNMIDSTGPDQTA